MRSTLWAGLALTLLAGASAQAADKVNAISAPAAKQIGVAKPQIEPALIVMNAAGATLKDGKLTLTGVVPNSILFADRPVRAAGHALTAHLLEEWSGDDSFAKDPPNATVSVLTKDASDVRDAVVVLKSPKASGSTITFDVQVLEGDLAGADGPAAVFIDIIGMPFTPLSYAGVARRTAYRAAWYGGAAAAAGAAAAYHPYYAPPPAYYPPPPAYYPPPPAYPYYRPY